MGRPRRGYEYARSQNPTRERLERAVAALEGGRHGIAFASGSATTAAIAQLATPGHEIVVGDDVYGGTYRYFERVHRASGVEARYVDLSPGPDLAVGGARPAGRVWSGSSHRPTRSSSSSTSRPRRAVVRQRAEARRRAAADRGRQHVRSPALQQPLGLGADIVFHSATKYLAGHSDTVTAWRSPTDDGVAERLRFLQNAMGGVPGPLDCFLVLRGLRTLHLRMERHAANALAVARFLAGRDDIAWLSYPGLAEGPHAHPQAALAARQMAAGGGMVSFVPRDGGRSGRPPASARWPSPRRPACSPWPNHSAASSRWSRCRP